MAQLKIPGFPIRGSVCLERLDQEPRSYIPFYTFENSRVPPTEATGSDHRTIETVLEMATPAAEGQERLLFKNTPWKEINARIAAALATTPTGDTVQEQTNGLIDYASNVWMHECRYKAAAPVNQIQKIGAQAIVGTFMKVATSVAEAEAHIATTQDRF
ncbi:hypothetical protein PG984_008028 [Apiospora sp. TS-2023a]